MEPQPAHSLTPLPRATESVRRHAVKSRAKVVARGRLSVVMGLVAAFQPDAHFGRVLAAYGGVFIAGPLVWGMAADGFRPDRWDITGAVVCLAGVGFIMYAPR
jgi:drug/metabolite transporter superfamily protein YnfA